GRMSGRPLPPRRRTSHEVLTRVAQLSAAALERAGLGPGTARVDAAAVATPRLPFAAIDDGALRAAYAANPAARDALLARATAAAAHRFDLLGFHALAVPAPIDWQRDPEGGVRAPDAHWSRLPILDATVVGDHKVTWELSRQQYLVTLGQAWRLTGDPSHAAAAARLALAWLEGNPPARGMNWASSLEVAFRAIAWTWTLHLCRDAAAFAPARARLGAALVRHARHLERFLSTYFSPNTHLTGEALALLAIGTAFPALPGAARFARRGWDVLAAQLPVQVRDDGTYFEQATWYQRYTVDFYVHATLLGAVHGWAFDADGRARIRLAAAAFAELLRADGTFPLLGDDDGGTLLPLSGDVTDGRDAVALAAVVLEEPALADGLAAAPPGPLWVAGRTVAPRAAAAPRTATARPLGGWFTLRDERAAPGTALLLAAGPHGVLGGGHGHADACALDLTLAGRPLLVDPGTVRYVGPERERFRAAASHNGLWFAGAAPARTAGPFRWMSFDDAEGERWFVTADVQLVQAVRDGYRHLPAPVTHRRLVAWLVGLGWLVLDDLEGPLPSDTVRGLTVAPGLDVTLDGAQAHLTAGGAPEGAVTFDDASGLSCEPAAASTCYGTSRPAWRLLHRDAARRPRLAFAIAQDPARPLVLEAAPDGTWDVSDGVVRWRVGWSATGPAPRLEATGGRRLALGADGCRLDDGPAQPAPVPRPAPPGMPA
ncbi:MAG: heparinase II/III family protein, partial [Gemmatimonadales bacterium]|nr:heparinase II/III family protein [Gemmatimonadales bacterium]